MRDENSVFQLMGETSASIYPLARDVMRPLFEEYFSEQRFYGVLFLAFNRAPEPISAEIFLKRNPYSNPASARENLEDAVETGYLEKNGSGGYLPAEKGSSAIKIVHEAFYSKINQVNEFPADDLRELAILLERLVDSAAQSDLAGGKFSYDTSRGGAIPVEPGTLAQVDQLLDHLLAFRDDAHIAAWKPSGVDGHTWEVLSFVWMGEAGTAEELVERLPYRQHTAENYRATLDVLAQKGWIAPGPDGYTVTEEGKGIRDGAEDATNLNYFGPWEVLSDGELSRLGELLAALKEINLKLTPVEDEG